MYHFVRNYIQNFYFPTIRLSLTVLEKAPLAPANLSTSRSADRRDLASSDRAIAHSESLETVVS